MSFFESIKFDGKGGKAQIVPLVLKAQLMLNPSLPAHANLNHLVNKLALQVNGWHGEQDMQSVLSTHAALSEAAKQTMYLPGKQIRGEQPRQIRAHCAPDCSRARGKLGSGLYFIDRSRSESIFHPATYIPTYLPLPLFRLIPELEWTSFEKRFGRLSKRFRFLSPVGTSRGGLCHERVRFQANLKTDVLVFR